MDGRNLGVKFVGSLFNRPCRDNGGRVWFNRDVIEARAPGGVVLSVHKVEGRLRDRLCQLKVALLVLIVVRSNVKLCVKQANIFKFK